jgi:hypothetical protein
MRKCHGEKIDRAIVVSQKSICETNHDRNAEAIVA